MAGGLVLGFGAAGTIAAWNDSEEATGNFTAGQFGIEGSPDGTNFTESPTPEEAATLNFAFDADELMPTGRAYTEYAVQLTDYSIYQAEVEVQTELTGANAAHITPAYVYTNDATCDAEAFAAGTEELANVPDFTLEDRTPVFVCFQLTASENLVPGATATLLTQFRAQATDELDT